MFQDDHGVGLNFPTHPGYNGSEITGQRGMGTLDRAGGKEDTGLGHVIYFQGIEHGHPKPKQACGNVLWV
jgi:hypothetical protein